MSSARYEILLPLQYNDGSRIEDALFQKTWAELVDRFHALTIEPDTLRGLWVHEEQQYEDTLVRLVVDVEDTAESEAFFREYKELLKERFKQIDVWITAYPIRII